MEKFPEIYGYRLEERLGAGGIAVVYSGIQIKTGHRVAVKILKPSLLQKYDTAKRFLKEAETVSGLDHPHIIKIFDVGLTNNYHYLVMEFLSKSLRDKTEMGNSTRSVRQNLEIIRKIAMALDYAHQRGIIHRDIKPENIMFRTDETPVLVDFGLAKISSSKESLTRSGITVGTPDYMSPEQIQGLSLDPASDIYSLGVVLYELLTGRVPYRASNYVTLALKHLKKKVPKLPRKFKYLQPLLNRMMAKKMSKRFTRAETLIRILEQIEEKVGFM
jgi:serine/threonine-protein kinase PpkA